MTTEPPFDDRDGVIWINGEMVEWREAKVHLLTHALHYGSGVFEGERVYGGEIFKLTEHTERLHASANMLDFKLPYTVEEIDQACIETIKAQNITDGYVRPVAWRGSEQMGISAKGSKINVAIAAWEWGSYFDPAERLKGIRIAEAKYRRPDPATIPAKAKAAGLYMICTIEKHRAEDAGFADAMMLDWRGYVAECTGANIFFIKDNVIHTPTPDCFLDGITRQTVIELARRRGIEVQERRIKPEELEGFEQCFVTGTAAEVTPVSSIGQNEFHVGEMIETLMNDYSQEVQPKKKVA